MTEHQAIPKRSARRSDGEAKPIVPVAITRGDNLVERLAGEISASIFPPGCRLDEVTLAARYGVSRTPVREALRQLESTGLIERRPFRGAIVSQPTPEALADMFVAASEIEAICARLAALSMTAAERNALRKAHDKMGEVSRGKGKDAYHDVNIAFHERIYAGAHNATIATAGRDLRRRLSPFRRGQFEAADRIAQSYAEHEEIVRAIERGHGDEAAMLMRQHMRQVEASIDDIAKR